MLMTILVALSIMLECILQVIAGIILSIIGFFALWGLSALTARSCRNVYDYIERKCS